MRAAEELRILLPFFMQRVFGVTDEALSSHSRNVSCDRGLQSLEKPSAGRNSHSERLHTLGRMEINANREKWDD
jgi:hypothetical protein